MAAMHRVMQSELHNKLAEENRERWAEWRQELEKRESAPGASAAGSKAGEDSDWQRGRVNHAAQGSSDEEEVTEGQEPGKYKSIVFIPRDQPQQREQLNSELKLRAVK